VSKKKRQEKNLLIALSKYILPSELVAYFELKSIREEEEALHLYLDGQAQIPPEYASLGLSSNGFYKEPTITDFPLRDRKVVLHVRRRRWIDSAGKSYSCSWDLTAAGTRYSKGFAYFLKETFGYLPDTGPIS
jgi:hypothetical protein